MDAGHHKPGNLAGRRWYVNSQGQTMVVIEGPVEFSMGAPDTDPDRFEGDVLHRRRIGRRFALGAKEVSVSEYQRFLQKDPLIDRSKLRRYSPEPDGPILDIMWYDAVAYCNWLSRQEGLAECYQPNEKGLYAEGMTIVARPLDRPGYRLPTEAEWEYACRAGTLTARYYGGSVELLGSYAWYIQNSRERAWPCGGLLPNDLGLFDMLGNVYEWCQDVEIAYPMRGAAVDDELENRGATVQEKFPRVLRGGAFTYRAANVRAANRNRDQPSYRGTYYGFRVARTLGTEPE
jgi:formylglycine-generating enzyme required for sulfatase activity